MLWRSRRRVLAITTSCSIWCGAGALGAAPAATGSAGATTLDEATLPACACRGDVAAAQAREEHAAAAAERSAAGVLPNPRLEATHARTLSGPSDHETVVGLAVPLPISGRRGALKAAADARGAAARAAARAARLESAVTAQQLFARALVARAKAEVLARQQRELDGLSAAVTQLARGGEAARYDAQRQALEARAHRQGLARARADADAAERALAVWLGEAVQLPVLDADALGRVFRSDPGPRGPSSVRDFAASSLVRDFAASSGTSQGREHPLVSAAKANARASALDARAERRAAVPEPELFAGYRRLDTDGATGHGFAVALSVPLPLFDYGQGAAARADAAATRARANAGALSRSLSVTAASESARQRALERSLSEDDDGADAARTVLSGARQLYAAGEATMSEVLDAHRAVERAELSRLETIEVLLASRIEAHRASGAVPRACEEDAR